MTVAGEKRTVEVMAEDAATRFADIDRNLEEIKRRRRRRSMEHMTQHPALMVHSATSELEANDSSPAEAGVIERLELKNFMCHDSFVLDFGPQINFIIGRNGSGKSAVLTGISVALGAKATDTDRGSSLKGFIKHGKNVSRATVTLLNRGQQAFKNEEYGDRIIIERVIKAEGAHSIFVKNHRGKTVSTKKATVDEILQFFSITIANPMTILTQTEAKNFLAHSSSADKFNSFMTGTRLKEAYENLKKTFNDAKEVSKALEEHEHTYNTVSKELEEAKEVVSKFTASKELERSRELIVGKFNWFFHLCNQYRYERCNELIEEKTKQKESKLESLENCKNTIQEDTKELDKANSVTLSESLKSVDEADLKLNLHKSTIKALKTEIQDLMKNISEIEGNIKSSEKDIEKTEHLIMEEENKLTKNIDGTTEKLRNFITQRSEEEKSLKRQLQELIDKVDDAKEEYERTRIRLSKEVNDSTINKKNAYEKLSNAKSKEAKNDPILLFNMANQKLIKEINLMKKNNMFKGEVRGPLGSHVKLNSQFKSAKNVIETLLTRPLTSILCENYSDMRLLMNLVSQCKLSNQVILKQPEVFDFSNEIPQSQHPSILDALDINDPIIKCQLVDTHKLHRVLLIRSRRDAEQVLLDDKQNSIASVICIVDGSGPVQMSKRNGGLQVDPVNRSRGESDCRLQIVGESLSESYQIEYDEAVEIAKEAQKNLQDELKPSKDIMIKLMNERDRIKKEWNDLGNAIAKTQTKLDSLTNEDVKLEYLKDQKSVLESKIAKAKDQLPPVKIDFDNKTKKMNEEIDIYNKVKLAFEIKSQEYKQLRKHLQELEGRITHKKKDAVILENEIRNIDENIRKVLEAAPGFKEIADDRKHKALQYCEIEETDLLQISREALFDKDQKREIEVRINNELERIETEIQKLEEERGITREAAETNLLNVNDKMKLVLKNRREMEKLWASLRTGLEERNDNLRQTTLSVFQEVENNFISALATRQFRGRIDFSIEKGTLSLMVATKEDAPLRVVESFSGGEKSYAQISFLFAIWGPMHSKIRGLDEFDVFMDQVNRRIALKLILDKVKQNSKRQTIFITPLSVSGIEGLSDRSVHIHEISPPERENI